MSLIEDILDLARWAPSGDNTQCWRFEINGALSVRVHGFDTREHCVYDLDGHPSQISLGALFATMEIAASAHRLGMRVDRDPEHRNEARPVFNVQFEQDQQVSPSPLLPFVKTRSVQRRPLKTTPLTQEQKRQLEASVGNHYRIHWVESAGARLRFAKMLFHSAKLRLITPEAYPTHRDIIDWDTDRSTKRIPDRALGAAPPTVAMMKFVLKSWGRVQFFNRYLAGTWAPRIELDFVPGFACAAHFVIVAKQPATTMDDYLAAGRAAQRFWLTATALGLHLQPEITPLVFSRYVHERRAFSQHPASNALAPTIKARLEGEIGSQVAEHAVFMGRVGQGPAPKARSLRMELADLMHRPLSGNEPQ